jgi:hypothetical protein
MRGIVVIVFAFCALALPGPGDALAFCSEPPREPPGCTDQTFERSFETDYDYDTCRRLVEDYLDDLDDWVACVADEADDRAEEAVNRFNCKVEGRNFCF